VLIPRVIAKTVAILSDLVRVEQGMLKGVSKHQGLMQFKDVICAGGRIGP
jgi:hypothetical protein